MTWSTELLLLGLLGCGREPVPEPEPPPAPAVEAPAEAPTTPAETPSTPAHWTVRTDLELDDLLRDTCEAAVADGRPVLLEFSAPWCVDCKLLKRITDRDPVRSELESWHRVVVDVGRFERHDALREAFEVAAIARWVALRPTDCVTPVTRWPRLREGTLEPQSGQEGPRTDEDVLRWLVEARGR